MNRSLWPDALRTLACVLVVMVHVNYITRPGIAEWWPGGFLSAPMYSLTVPLFLAVAGYFSRCRDSAGRPIPPTRYFAGLARRLGLPLLFWGGVLMWLGTEEPVESAGALALQLVSGPWQLYFLFALLQLHALHYIIEVQAPGMRRRTLLLWAAALSLACFAASDLAVWRLGGHSHAIGYYGRKVGVLWAVFYGMGVVLRAHPRGFARLWRLRWVLAALTLGSVAAFAWELRHVDAWLGFIPVDQTLIAALPTGVFGTLALLTAAEHAESTRLGRGFLRLLASGAPDTYGVYLVHTAVLLPLFAWYQATPWYRVDGWVVPITAAVTVLASVAVVRTARLPGVRRAGALALGVAWSTASTRPPRPPLEGLDSLPGD